METKIAEITETIKPSGIFHWLVAVAGFVAAWWTGLPPLVQALIGVQAADIITGLLCALFGKSEKSETGRLSSSAMAMGVAKKGLEWLVVWVCMEVGGAVGIANVSAAALTYMMATELVSLMENLKLFGLDVPLLNKLLDVANGGKESEDSET